MAKRTIGIDLSPVHVRAVQLLETPQGPCVEKTFATRARRATDSVPDILRRLFETAGFDRRARIAVSLPADAVFFRNIATDADGLEQLRKANLAALRSSFPIPADKIVAQPCTANQVSDAEFSVLTAAVSTDTLAQTRRALARARLRHHLIDAPVFAVNAALRISQPAAKAGRALIAYLDEACLTLAVLDDGDILIVRNIPVLLDPEDDIDTRDAAVVEILAREAQITWHKAFNADMDPDAAVFLLTVDADAGSLKPLLEQKIDAAVAIVDPAAGLNLAQDQTLCPAMHVALGLALRIADPEAAEGVDFLAAANEQEKMPINLRKELITYAALAAGLVLLMVLGLFLRLNRLESAYADVKTRIHETFTTALPDEKNVVNPALQMQRKLESFRRDSQLFASFSPAAIGPLQVLKAVSEAAPPHAGIVVDDTLIAPDSIRITAACNAFEPVYEWQRALKQVPAFTSVEVRDVQKDPKSGTVRFTVLISTDSRGSL